VNPVLLIFQLFNKSWEIRFLHKKSSGLLRLAHLEKNFCGLIIVELHAIVRNKTEKFYSPLSLFPLMET
jgi:hypothetical protein